MTQHSQRHRYYMTCEKDQLRFLCGMDKTYRDRGTGQIKVAVKGNTYTNPQAVREFEMMLLNNIAYYNGELGEGLGGNVLTEDQVAKSIGLRKSCEYELRLLRKKFPEIL